MMKSKMGHVLATGAVLALGSGAASAAIDVTEAVAELDGLIVPIGLLGGAALVVAITIKVWRRIRGAA